MPPVRHHTALLLNLIGISDGQPERHAIRWCVAPLGAGTIELGGVRLGGRGAGDAGLADRVDGRKQPGARFGNQRQRLAIVGLVGLQRLVGDRYFDLEAQLYGDAIIPKNGTMAVPQAPGLGLDPDPEVIREYRLR